jgi:hypothetical protein
MSLRLHGRKKDRSGQERGHTNAPGLSSRVAVSPLPLMVREFWEKQKNTKEKNMTWIGSWRNQYGSVLEITEESNGRIEGRFQSAVDGRIKGKQVAVVGVHQGDLISFIFNGAPYASFVVAWTGLLRDGRIQTLFHSVASEKLTAEAEGSPARNKSLGTWEAISTGGDVFERIS